MQAMLTMDGLAPQRARLYAHRVAHMASCPLLHATDRAQPFTARQPPPQQDTGHCDAPSDGLRHKGIQRHCGPDLLF